MQIPGFTNISDALCAGIYMLVAKERVIYIGKSRKMISRIDTHRRIYKDKRSAKLSWLTENLNIPGVLFDEVHIMRCRVEDLDRLERELIDVYRPPLNKNLQRSGTIRAPISLLIGGHTLTLGRKAEPLVRRF